ncbi:N-acetyldiaminopimelate deacetylase [invertebrate metagenome]|uniref:N-acetyldiaminopimelate deacetylase n=1 Tax=invertebrate metagenome TaxID=1711999 RepID=A0A2H9T6Y1_9ZZZZ
MCTSNLFSLDDELITLKPFSIETRHHLHRIPEPSGKELETSQYCRQLMQEAGYEIKTLDGFTGFTADLKVSDCFNLMAIRTDIDALEMDDLTENDCRSEHPGYAHNCGHDVHMTIALTAALFLSKHREKLKHNIRFIFQMAEEDMRVPGAEKMVEQGCMEGVSEVYALHNDASLEYGTVHVNSSLMSSYGSAWTLDVHGISTHGSTPHKGLDAIREAARIIADMDYIVAKKTDPFNPAVFGCGMFNGGSIPNAVADYVQARGTIRAMDAETDTVLKAALKDITKESEVRGYTTTMDYSGYPAVINHNEAYHRIIEAAKDCVPQSRINSHCSPMTGSEDFSFMVNAVPDKKGAMFFLGSGNKEKGICNYLHSNPYYVDDDSLLIGTQIFINLATR